LQKKNEKNIESRLYPYYFITIIETHNMTEPMKITLDAYQVIEKIAKEWIGKKSENNIA